MKKYSLLFAMVLSLWACKEQACFVEKGAYTQLAIAISDFDTLKITDQVEVYLSYNTTGNYELTVATYEGYLSSLFYEQKGNTLQLGDKRICAWAKDFHQPKFYLSVPNLRFIHHRGFGKLCAVGKLPFDDLYLFLEDCFADVDLYLESEKFRYVSNSYSTLNLKGNAQSFSIFHAYNSGILKASTFACDRINITQLGNGEMHIFPIDELTGFIRNTGNVYVYNEPDSLNVEELNIGKFINVAE